MLLHRFRTGHEPLLPQGLKVTCKENEESVPGCSKTMHSAAKKKMLVLVKIIVILKENKPRRCAERADGRVCSSLPEKDDRK